MPLKKNRLPCADVGARPPREAFEQLTLVEFKHSSSALLPKETPCLVPLVPLLPVPPL